MIRLAATRKSGDLVFFRFVHAILYRLKRSLGVGWDARAEAKKKIQFIAAMRDGSHPEAWAAVQFGDVCAVRKALVSGVDANETDPQGESLLMRAASGGSTEVVKVLLAAGAEVNHQSFEGNSALHLAVDTAVQFAEVVQSVLDEVLYRQQATTSYLSLLRAAGLRPSAAELMIR
ncbi:MAG: ankyrin repeat domain-containing protein [Planctomycetes bacterium]|nr:ankyrin repeat domain-containing protein [Planctomycetota bacterium]